MNSELFWDGKLGYKLIFKCILYNKKLYIILKL